MGIFQLVASIMSKYFFHLAGIMPAHDPVDYERENDEEARDHGSLNAHRIGTEKPEMVREENSIWVVNKADHQIATVPLASMIV